MRNDAQMLLILIADKSRPSRSPVVAMIVPASALITGLEEVSKRCAGTGWAISTVSPHDGPGGRFVPERPVRSSQPAAAGWGPAREWP